MRILYLGDIHGNFALIGQYIDNYGIKDAHIIQVGDFGVGFQTFEKEKRMLELYHQKLVKNNVIVYAVRGNHDRPDYFDNDPFGFTNIKLVKDYTVLNLEGNNILCIGGAISVDRMIRKTKLQRDGDYTIQGNESWWNDEGFVLDVDKLNVKDINIVVTHTCPDYCEPENTFGLGYFVEGIIKETGDVGLRDELNKERKMLTDAFAVIKLNNNIDFHYYGHFHKSNITNIYGTKHRLLGVGELWEERDNDL